MDVKLIETGINDKGEQMYLLIFEYNDKEVSTLKLNSKDLKKLSKKTFSLINNNIK
jgi:hypothetical protein